jgi:peptide/nickel transport system substrate-binding protein
VASRSRLAGIAVAVAASLALVGCNSSSQQTGKASELNLRSLPTPAGSAEPGGDVVAGLSSGTGPTWIFPYQPSQFHNFDMIGGFINLMWRPLYWSYVGEAPEVNYPESLAKEPEYSADTKTVTLKLNDGYTWSDGKPVVAADVVFALSILKAGIKESAANYYAYSPGEFPDNVASATTPDERTVVLRLTGGVNPSWFTENVLTQLIPLPSTKWNRTATEQGLDYTNPAVAARIYSYLFAQSSDPKTYATNPLWKIVNGPFVIDQYSPASNEATLVPNKAYTGPGKANIKSYKLKPFTSPAALLSAIETGTVDIARVPPANMEKVPDIQKKGYNVFKGETTVFYPITYNFKNKTGNFAAIISQLYIRQALAHLQDQAGVVKGVFKGFAVETYGPLPSTPTSKYHPENTLKNPYPFDIDKAAGILKDHGWEVRPGGVTTCTAPGSGPNQCGAGIPQGAELKWKFYYNNGPQTNTLQAQALASNAKRVGIDLELVGKDAAYMIQNLSNVSNPQNADEWGMKLLGGEGSYLNPTSNNLYNTGGSSNSGSYSNPKADALIKASVVESDPAAAKAEIEFLTTDQPALFTPSRSAVIAWTNKLAGPPNSFASYVTGQTQPQYWWFTK